MWLDDVATIFHIHLSENLLSYFLLQFHHSDILISITYWIEHPSTTARSWKSFPSWLLLTNLHSTGGSFWRAVNPFSFDFDFLWLASCRDYCCFTNFCFVPALSPYREPPEFRWLYMPHSGKKKTFYLYARNGFSGRDKNLFTLTYALRKHV